MFCKNFLTLLNAIQVLCLCRSFFTNHPLTTLFLHVVRHFTLFVPTISILFWIFQHFLRSFFCLCLRKMWFENEDGVSVLSLALEAYF